MCKTIEVAIHYMRGFIWNIIRRSNSKQIFLIHWNWHAMLYAGSKSMRHVMLIRRYVPIKHVVSDKRFSAMSMEGANFKNWHYINQNQTKPQRWSGIARLRKIFYISSNTVFFWWKRLLPKLLYTSNFNSKTVTLKMGWYNRFSACGWKFATEGVI